MAEDRRDTPTTPADQGLSPSLRPADAERPAPRSHSGAPTRAPRWSVPTAVAITAAYTTVSVCLTHQWYPDRMRTGLNGMRSSILAALAKPLALFYEGPETSRIVYAVYLILVMGAVPWALMALLRRGRPSDLGLRMPNRYAWRMLGVAFVVALPFIYWMSCTERFADWYLPELHRGVAALVAYYAVTILVEHFFFHGVMLGALRRGGRWPNAVSTLDQPATSARTRALRWVGIAHDTEQGQPQRRRLQQWLGLPDGCLFAILASGVLFAWMHLGKAPREALLSLPGGIALAYFAYRGNSLLAPLVLHAATAAAALAFLLARQP